MDKIKLRLCAGTMCYVMGGAQLMEIEELLSEEENPITNYKRRIKTCCTIILRCSPNGSY